MHSLTMIRSAACAAAALLAATALAGEHRFRVAPGSTSLVEAGVAAPLVGTFVGDWDATANPTGTRTIRGLFGGNTSTGATFTSLTTTSKLFVTLNGGTPLSVTAIVTVLVPGPCASLGVQVKIPDAPPIAVPAGALSSENVSGCVGTSESLAVSALRVRSVVPKESIR